MSDDLTKPAEHGNRPDALAAPRKVSVRIWLDADVVLPSRHDDRPVSLEDTDE